jgi:hypothetical protein
MQLADLRDTPLQYSGVVGSNPFHLSKTLLYTLIFFSVRRFLPNWKIL